YGGPAAAPGCALRLPSVAAVATTYRQQRPGNCAGCRPLATRPGWVAVRWLPLAGDRPWVACSGDRPCVACCGLVRRGWGVPVAVPWLRLRGHAPWHLAAASWPPRCGYRTLAATSWAACWPQRLGWGVVQPCSGYGVLVTRLRLDCRAVVAARGSPLAMRLGWVAVWWLPPS